MYIQSVDRSNDHGPFDIIGDLHGCFDELEILLQELGYRIETQDSPAGSEICVTPPNGRKAVFLGDLVDRGPKVVPVLKLVMGMVKEDKALCVPGNHDHKLLRKLNGRNVQMTHGLPETMEQLAKEPLSFHEEVIAFFAGLPSHYVLDDGKLIVAHAGLKEALHGIESREVMEFALFGQPTGETDRYGLPVRYDWAGEYRGKPMVVYGHTPVAEGKWVNKTIDIDTGCIFGGKLTALRYPELDLVEVKALKTYIESVKPFLHAKGLS